MFEYHLLILFVTLMVVGFGVSVVGVDEYIGTFLFVLSFVIVGAVFTDAVISDNLSKPFIIVADIVGGLVGLVWFFAVKYFFRKALAADDLTQHPEE